jgi:hypothetical protein
MLSINLSCFDDLPAEAWARYLFIDAESEGAGWAVVVRGQDRRIVGRTATPWEADLIFNDTAGDYRRFVLAMADSLEAAETMAGQLRDFYRSTEPLSVRLAAADSSLLPTMLATFGAHDFQTGAKSGRRCERFAMERRKRNRVEQLEEMTR